MTTSVSYMPRGYWEARKHLAYYGAVRSLIESLSPRASILDVGGWDTPVVLWGEFERRYTCDLGRDPCFPDVVSHVGDFLEWTPPERMSLTVCCQVIEHFPLEKAKAFAQKLLASAEVVIITVPYNWPKGEPSHYLDPIDEAKLAEIVGRAPDTYWLVRDGKRDRLVALYRTSENADA